MLRLLYISTARQPHDDRELDQILRISRRNNAGVGVTGLLVAGGRRFLQILEGPEQSVQQTYDRICLDPRHFAAVTLSRKTVDSRLFPAWAMGFQPAVATITTGRVDEEIAALIAPISDPTVKAYFSEFAERHAFVGHFKARDVGTTQSKR